jgi:D-alanyl-D-alanine-carboxypeptidase/D-alanyl-D-alanine-endopeptidase
MKCSALMPEVRRTLASIAVLLLAPGMNGQKVMNAPVMTDAEIRQILEERIDQKHQSVGIVVGVIEDRGERFIPYGALNRNDPRPLTSATVFEIGGLTSVFTSLLLADMSLRREVALDDPVSKYLPATVKLPSQGTRVITLTDLATHTAGLPLVPTNLHPLNPANPYADYTENDLYKSLVDAKLTGRLGTDYSYSNVGMSLLAIALSHRAGQTYEVLLKARILDPLGMKSTGVGLTPDMGAHFSVGHNSALQPVSYWDAPALVGAVGLKSTTQDLLTFVEAELGYRQTPLAAQMAAMLNLRRPTRFPGLELALGWHVLSTNTAQIIWDNGGTGGFRAFMGFSPRTKVGIVVLSNADGPNGIEDIGLRLFSPTPPDVSFQRERTEIKVDPRLLASYAGDYQLSDGMLLRIQQDGDHLEAQLGQQRFQLSAESSRDFFVKNVEGQMTFVTDRSGNAYMVVLHQAGTDLPAKRIR